MLRYRHQQPCHILRQQFSLSTEFAANRTGCELSYAWTPKRVPTCYARNSSDTFRGRRRCMTCEHACAGIHWWVPPKQPSSGPRSLIYRTLIGD